MMTVPRPRPQSKHPGDPSTADTYDVLWASSLEMGLAPEQRLMLAVLRDAVTVLERHGASKRSRSRQLCWEVECWLRSDDEERLFSFVPICRILGIDSRKLRRRLEQLCGRRSRPSTAPLAPVRSTHRATLRCAPSI